MVGPTVSDSITAAFTTTFSPPPPQAAAAPVVVNNTYASSNLLGLLLANSFLQAEIYNALGMGTQSSFALWSNDSINVDNLCNTASVSISNNLITGPCYTTGSNGSLTSSTVTTGSQTASVQTYENVLSLYPNSQSNTAINLWDAILTGSDITTVQSSGATNNGYMQLVNPSISAFSPPTQLVDNTGTNPPITAVNTTFSVNTGILSLASYQAMQAGVAGVGTYPIPTGVPSLNLVVGQQPMSGQGITYELPQYSTNGVANNAPFGYYSYNSSSGVLTMNGYWGSSNGSSNQSFWFSNSTQSINMTTCPVDSGVTLTINANPANNSAYGAAGTLSCSPISPISPITAANSAIPATAPTLYTVNTAMPIPSSGAAPAFYTPNNPSLSAQNSNLWNYSATGSLTSTIVTNTNGSVTAPTIAAASSNVTAVTSSSSTTSGVTTTITTVPPGYLMVTGYGYSTTSGTQTVAFANGVQSLDMTSCATNTATLTVYPSATRPVCQSVPKPLAT